VQEKGEVQIEFNVLQKPSLYGSFKRYVYQQQKPSLRDQPIRI
jgi:hypothetical protein